ncbi:hypothetical protein [Helicobacter saguini]|uniref:hypothetical protein n=1 Tax=Helicobacter saguini TaxID=1548018 RepID=UPI000ADA62D6|nr:hypothetical protein [Helicobacter saguini]
MGNLCFFDKCFSTKQVKIDNDITKVKLDSILSKDTINFVNRYKILAHEPNKQRSIEKGK